MTDSKIARKPTQSATAANPPSINQELFNVITCGITAQSILQLKPLSSLSEGDKERFAKIVKDQRSLHACLRESHREIFERNFTAGFPSESNHSAVDATNTDFKLPNADDIIPVSDFQAQPEVWDLDDVKDTLHENYLKSLDELDNQRKVSQMVERDLKFYVTVYDAVKMGIDRQLRASEPIDKDSIRFQLKSYQEVGRHLSTKIQAHNLAVSQLNKAIEENNHKVSNTKLGIAFMQKGTGYLESCLNDLKVQDCKQIICFMQEAMSRLEKVLNDHIEEVSTNMRDTETNNQAPEEMNRGRGT